MINGYKEQEIQLARVCYSFGVYELFERKPTIDLKFMEWYMSSKYTNK